MSIVQRIICLYFEYDLAMHGMYIKWISHLIQVVYKFKLHLKNIYNKIIWMLNHLQVKREV
jgi:hypothetical protein